MCYNGLSNADKMKREIKMAEKKMTDLKTFIENVNKKDKTNGKKIVFAFTKQKRK